MCQKKKLKKLGQHLFNVHFDPPVQIVMSLMRPKIRHQKQGNHDQSD